MPDQTVHMSIEGMTCDHCVRAVTRALQETAGVHTANVSLESKSADVTFDDEKTNTDALKAAVAEEGYSASIPG
jgi:copper ion binding protein